MMKAFAILLAVGALVPLAQNVDAKLTAKSDFDSVKKAGRPYGAAL